MESSLLRGHAPTAYHANTIIAVMTLTFLSHIKMPKNECPKTLNISKFVSSTEWCADSTVLIKFI
jgi:hypothetical protein